VPSPHLSAPRLMVVVGSVFALAPSALPAAGSPSFDLVFPQDAVATTFTSSFGAARSGGRSHHGNDLMAPKMSPVYAAADGVVTIIDEGPRSGRWIAIDHGDGWETWYMHLNNDTSGTDDAAADWTSTVAPGVFEGAEVEAGRLIAWVGDSGNAEPSSPHTHFELHHAGAAVDPYPYLADAYVTSLREVTSRVVPAISTFIREVGSTPRRPAHALE